MIGVRRQRRLCQLMLALLVSHTEAVIDEFRTRDFSEDERGNPELQIDDVVISAPEDTELEQLTSSVAWRERRQQRGSQRGMGRTRQLTLLGFSFMASRCDELFDMYPWTGEARLADTHIDVDGLRMQSPSPAECDWAIANLHVFTQYLPAVRRPHAVYEQFREGDARSQVQDGQEQRAEDLLLEFAERERYREQTELLDAMLDQRDEEAIFA